MFIGEYQHSIDDKGRLAIPAKFRSKLEKDAVVTRGLDNCLFLYTGYEWNKLAQKLIALPMTQARSRAFLRLMLAGAYEVATDGQGRITIPNYLIEYARLKKRTVVAGLYSRIEIWDAKAWEKYKTKTESDSDKIAESLGELGV